MGRNLDLAKYFEGSDSPYIMKLGQEAGSQFQAKPPFPDANILECDEVYVRRMVLQRTVVRAFTPGENGARDIEVVRLVAELEGGDELEIFRTADEMTDPVPSPANADKARCAGCHGNIPHGDGIPHGDDVYHERCLTSSDDVRGHVPKRRLKEI